MYCGETAPWDHFPKNLRIGEFLDPLQVIVEFFSTGLPPEQLRKLEEWRYFVIEEEYYNDPELGPEPLLLRYDLHLRLMEATYLKLLKFRDDNIQPQSIQPGQFENECLMWSYFPADFSGEELADPYRILEHCFYRYPPQDYRDNLHAWLHVALSTRTDFETLPPGEIISFYENMQRLCKGAWMIRQREAENAVLKR
ncbi:hypothetical protein [Mucilaginibacter ginsenosidivorax]|uniref:Uncharacterized protein n=1 Tax=Mucilaginibacter ginsenosidivorax TaxID=862126 RepID=A0A5B8W330_9SPHI|nr:hypothetical protein [Mucilaginibacter ginsenosidivorax]QEC77276.1 hypothetical protein FSB76_15485 [Mucilaginibacter ginsenosidivorax]